MKPGPGGAARGLANVRASAHHGARLHGIDALNGCRWNVGEPGVLMSIEPAPPSLFEIRHSDKTLKLKSNLG